MSRGIGVTTSGVSRGLCEPEEYAAGLLPDVLALKALVEPGVRVGPDLHVPRRPAAERAGRAGRPG